MSNLERYKTIVDKETGKYELLSNTLSEHKKQLELLEHKTQAIIEAQAFIQKVATDTQKVIVVHLNDLVNKVLQTTFPEYSFEMKFSIQRSKSECVLKFYKGEHETDLLDGDSGGALNVACIALRLAVWTLSNADNCLVLDEAFANLSQGLQPLMGQILKEMSTELGVQLILVSHSPNIDVFADKVHTVKQKNGVSYVK